jgi:hypothetical protein
MHLQSILPRAKLHKVSQLAVLHGMFVSITAFFHALVYNKAYNTGCCTDPCPELNAKMAALL